MRLRKQPRRIDQPRLGVVFIFRNDNLYERFLHARGAGTLMAMHAAGALQQKIDGRDLRDHAVEVEVQRLLHHLRADEDGLLRAMRAVLAEAADAFFFQTVALTGLEAGMEEHDRRVRRRQRTYGFPRGLRLRHCVHQNAQATAPRDARDGTFGQRAIVFPRAQKFKAVRAPLYAAVDGELQRLPVAHLGDQRISVSDRLQRAAVSLHQALALLRGERG